MNSLRQRVMTGAIAGIVAMRGIWLFFTYEIALGEGQIYVNDADGIHRVRALTIPPADLWNFEFTPHINVAE